MLGGGDASGVRNEEDEPLIYSRIDTQTSAAWDAGITPRVTGKLRAGYARSCRYSSRDKGGRDGSHHVFLHRVIRTWEPACGVLEKVAATSVEREDSSLAGKESGLSRLSSVKMKSSG